MRPSKQGDTPEDAPSDLYRKAAEVGKDTLDDQVAELDSMRARSVQFLSFVGTATAFLVGTSIGGQVDRGVWFGVFGGVATVGVLAMLLLLRSLLTGTRYWVGGEAMDWHYRIDPTNYINWLDLQGPRATDAMFYRHLTETYREQKENNEKYLRVIRRRYVAFLFVATFALFVWGLLAWYYGGRP